MHNFYENFVSSKHYDDKLQKCIEETVEQLLTRETDVEHPGLLLGMIQSGKTRAFIGVIARAFDGGYDVAVVLTKGTKALAEQTLQRLQGEFKSFIDDELVRVYDIMKLPPKLTKYVFNQKLIFIVKKEDDNLYRLEGLIDQYPIMQEKRVLIIDDEADFASVGYRTDKSKPDKMEINPLAKQISQFRTKLKGKTDFLQVTATPYSLYLQPDAICLNGNEYQPVRPAFTSLVPIHDLYIGGKFYFEDSLDSESTAYYLHVNVPEKEIDILGKKDTRYLVNILTTPNLDIFRSAIVNFIVAGSIRNLQNKQSGQRRYKYSFIIHTETSKPKHEWQLQLVQSLVEQLKSATETDLKGWLNRSYEHFLPSLKLLQSQLVSYYIPDIEEVYNIFKNAIQEEVDIRKINSDHDVLSLLDEKGQLKLDNPFNIFIGGQILDRGLTIENLIGFFYGRNPKRFQQDTVLQHSRMYGVRSKEDLAVTRFYTSGRIYNAMKKMYEFDAALRESFEKGEQKDGVIFIQKDKDGNIIPCSPGKVLPDSTTTLKPYSTLRAMGFQTKDKTHIANTIEEIDGILREFCGHKGKFDNQFKQQPFLLPLEQALSICDLINDTFEYSDKQDNNIEEFKAVIEHLCKIAGREKIYCYVRGGREISRLKEQSNDFNTPDGGSDRTEAKKVAKEIPCLMLLKQKGEKGGWCGAEFYWPVLITPENTKTCVYSSETQE
jgi:Z1 domain